MGFIIPHGLIFVFISMINFYSFFNYISFVSTLFVTKYILIKIRYSKIKIVITVYKFNEGLYALE